MAKDVPALTGLQQYIVNEEFYFFSLILEVIFVLTVIVLLIHSITKTCADIRDPEYIQDKQYQNIVNQMRVNETGSEVSDQYDQEDETEENKRKQKKFVKIERRILEALAFFIVAIISINTFTSKLAEGICVAIAVILFVVFNLTWAPSKWAKMLYLFALLAAYMPIFIYKHRFGNYST